MFHLIFSFSGEGFMGINVIWCDLFIYIMNIYSSCFIQNKRKLWKESYDLKKVSSGEWCITRDFNAIKREAERKGQSNLVNRGGMFEFWEFIESLDLVDVPLSGSKFSWFKLDGRVMSHLDYSSYHMG